ncbi:plasmid related protein [Cupriavidus sp. 8B]
MNAAPLLARHVRGDWGLVPAEDAQANRFAVDNGLRIVSAYEVAGERIWIITEAAWSATTLLLPEEY